MEPLLAGQPRGTALTWSPQEVSSKVHPHNSGQGWTCLIKPKIALSRLQFS